MNKPLPTLAPPKTLVQDNYVPVAQHERENLGVMSFAKEKIFEKLIGGGAGGFIGGLAARTFKFNAALGTLLGATAGFFVTEFRHWAKTNKRQIHVVANFQSVKEALDPAAMKQELEKEQAVLDDLKKLEALMDKPKVHTTDITARRESAEQSAGRAT